jgi:uncharacterized protein (DUF305 family)
MCTSRPILIAIAGLALAAALAGCSSTADTGAAASSTPSANAGMMNGSATSSPGTGGSMMNGSTDADAGTGSAADIAFTQLMIPHHQQAIQMADLAASNAVSPEVKALAAQIKAAQGPEITMMGQWLAGWGGPSTMPSATANDSTTGGMGMGGMTVAGMMSAADMTNLGHATGAAFDTMWLQMMITHHQGAIAMAQQLATTTTNPQVKALAEAITASQTAEITTMQQMLAK